MPSLTGPSGLSGLSGLVGSGYSGKVLSTQSANLIAYWPLWEASGAVANDISGNGYNGAYTGVTLGQTGIGDGNTAPLFDGANDYVDVYSAGFAGAFNSAEGTVSAWIRVLNLGVWTDIVAREILSLFAGGNNYVQLFKSSIFNRVDLIYRAGGVSRTVSVTGLTSTGWLHFAITWSASADEVRGYMNGTQQGATLGGLGVWAGALNANLTLIGAQTKVPVGVWSGWLAHAAVWDTPLTPTQIATLAVV